MTARRTPDKAGVTPEIVMKGTTLRSRKCLDMNPRASPLSERSDNLPSPLRTPSTAKHFCPDSPSSSSNRQVPSPGEGTGSSSPLSDLSDLSIPLPSNVIDSIPSIIPKTPQPHLRRLSSGKQILTPLLKTTMKTFSIEKNLRKEEAKITVSPALASIVSKSFYSSGSRTPQSVSASASLISKQKVKPANLKRKSTGSKGSLKHHRSRSAGGKRKRTGTFGFGGGHAIKKPKLNLSIETKPVKISELPVPVMVDLPSSSSSYKETMPKTPARSIATPTSGSLTMSGTTKVQFECKAGQFVFRAKAKTATTPIRRSPRKHMSPLKNDYFTNSGSKKNKMKTSGKLFSPESNYLRPEKSISSEGANIPSPVKFVSETDDDLGDLISSLARDQAIEISVPVSAQPVSSLLSTTNEFPDVSDAVNNILNDLSSGDDNDSVVEEVINPHATISDNSSAPHGAGDGSHKLFSIFYKNAATCSDEGMPNNASLGEEKKKFVCSSLSENQAIIDAGQKRMGAVQCVTCGGVYSAGDPEEEAAHTRLHQGLSHHCDFSFDSTVYFSGRLEKLKLPGWKNERAVGHFPSGRVLCVKPGDHATHWRKVDEVLSVVDSDLGFSEVGIRWPDKTKVFMYVADKKVVGLLLAETIDRAYRIIPNNGNTYMSIIRVFNFTIFKHLQQ